MASAGAGGSGGHTDDRGRWSRYASYYSRLFAFVYGQVGSVARAKDLANTVRDRAEEECPNPETAQALRIALFSAARLVLMEEDAKGSDIGHDPKQAP